MVRVRSIGHVFFFIIFILVYFPYFGGVFDETIIPLTLIGNDIITASAMRLVRYLPSHI